MHRPQPGPPVTSRRAGPAPQPSHRRTTCRPDASAPPPQSVTGPPVRPPAARRAAARRHRAAGPVRPGGGGLAPLPPGPAAARGRPGAPGSPSSVSAPWPVSRATSPRRVSCRAGGRTGSARSPTARSRPASPPGLVCGVAFTLLPLLVLRGVVRRSGDLDDPVRPARARVPALRAEPHHAVRRPRHEQRGARRRADVRRRRPPASAARRWPVRWSAPCSPSPCGGCCGPRRRRKGQIADLRARLAERDAVKPAPADADKDD